MYERVHMHSLRMYSLSIYVCTGHLLLALGQTVEHMMREDDRLELDAGCVAVFAGEHVDLALVDAELADVCLEEEDVGALHDWVQDLGCRERVLEPTHDLAALLDARDGEAARNVERLRPVAQGVRADLVRRPEELDTLHVHPRRRPHLDEVLPDCLDAIEVATHLVVHQGEPVSDPEDERAARTGALVDVHCLEHALRDVHPARGLETVVQHKVGLLEDQVAQLRLGDALLAHAANRRIVALLLCVQLCWRCHGGCRGLRRRRRRSLFAGSLRTLRRRRRYSLRRGRHPRLRLGRRCRCGRHCRRFASSA